MKHQVVSTAHICISCHVGPMSGYMRDTKKMVTTVTAMFKTLIPQGKSINQREKTLWNKGLNFAVYKSYIKPIQSVYFCISYCFLIYFPIVFPLLK